MEKIKEHSNRGTQYRNSKVGTPILEPQCKNPNIEISVQELEFRNPSAITLTHEP